MKTSSKDMTIIRATDTNNTFRLWPNIDDYIIWLTRWGHDEFYQWRMPDSEAQRWADFASHQIAINDAIIRASHRYLDLELDVLRIYTGESDMESAQRKACEFLGIDYE